MDNMSIGVCIGFVAGILFMLFPTIAVDRDSIWYRSGYCDGYEDAEKQKENE